MENMENVQADAVAPVATDADRVPERLTILHLGDVLLDGPVQRLRRDTKEHRREELRESFEDFMRCVETEKANAVIFSGNLLDGRYAEDDTLTFLIKAFAAHPSCHFVIAPGPRDPYVKESIYRSKRLPRNVHVFVEEIVGLFSFTDIPLTVYGWGYQGETSPHAPLSSVHRTPNDRFTVLCGYTQMDADATLSPIDTTALADFAAHYAAFTGKAHDGFHRVGDGVYAYSGSFEGHDVREGEAETGGYVRLCAKRREGGWSVEATRVPIGTYAYVTERLDVSHLSTAEEAKTRLRARIAARGHGERTVLRVILCGSVSLDASFAGVESEDYGVYSLWVEDRTVPTDNGDLLLQEMNARGELYRYFYPKMTDGPEEDRARAARAFRIGYAALLGEDFAKF